MATLFTQSEYQLVLKCIMQGLKHIKPEERAKVNMLANRLKALQEIGERNESRARTIVVDANSNLTVQDLHDTLKGAEKQ